MVITICSSASFTKQAVEVKKELEELGFQVIVPKVARLEWSRAAIVEVSFH